MSFNISDIASLVDEDTKREVMDYASERLKDGQLAVELGVYLGGTITRLVSNLEKQNKKLRVFAIDNWLCNNISDESLKEANLKSVSAVYDKFIDNLFNCG